MHAFSSYCTTDPPTNTHTPSDRTDYNTLRRIFAVKFRKHTDESWFKTNTFPQVCCRTSLWKVNVQLYSFTFILARTISLSQATYVSWVFICLSVFFSSKHWHLCNSFCYILFVPLIVPFSYEVKTFSIALNNTQSTHSLTIGRLCTTKSMNAWRKQTI